MKKIKNLKILGRSPLRRAALAVAEAGLQAIDTVAVVRDKVQLADSNLAIAGKPFDLQKVKRVFVVGVGKCALEAGQALEEILDSRLTAGIVVDVHPGKLKKLRAYSGTHPWPTEKNVDVTREIIKLLRRTTTDDLVIFIISGGGSTLLCQPTNFACIDERRLLESLFAAGATIREINIMRKHLSLARGGYLAKYAYPSAVVSLIISDVPGDNLEYIASGPTIRDNTTVAEARRIHQRYHAKLHGAITPRDFIETPKAQKYFRRVQNIFLVTNRTALAAMAKQAKALGFRARLVSEKLQGEARLVAARILRLLHGSPRKTLLLYGGETTVTVTGPGQGGRCQELALAGLKQVRPNELLLPLASDGRDNTDAAGAICDILTKRKARRAKLVSPSFLARNDSYTFFRELHELVRTGDTGSNVSDLIIAAKN